MLSNIMDALVDEPDADSANGSFDIMNALDPDAAVVGGGLGALIFGGKRDAADMPADQSQHWAFAGMKLNQSECAAGAPGAPCSSAKVIAAMGDFAKTEAATNGGGDGANPSSVRMKRGGPAPLPSAQTKEAEVVRKAAAVTNCDSESCVVSNPKFVRFAEGRGIAVRAEKERAFKVAGPRGSTELLSNYHIDETLRRWARSMPDLFTYDFVMMDFDKTGEPFDTLDVGDILDGKRPQKLGSGFAPVSRRPAMLACVLNTDHSGGDGLHWVAAFVDCRSKGSAPWTVEYFDSAGDPPPKSMVGWMERTRARLDAYRKAHPALGGGPVQSVAVTSVGHQQGKTECGLYSLFYIRRRAEGTPYSFFASGAIPDDVMTTFRKSVFRAA